LLKTNVNERFSKQEVIIIIKLLLSIIFNGFPVLTFPVCIVLIFRSPEKRWIEVSLYFHIHVTPVRVSAWCLSQFMEKKGQFQSHVCLAPATSLICLG
jgi:hypothetical protein